MSNEIYVYHYSTKDLDILKSNIRARVDKSTEDGDYEDLSIGKKLKGNLKYLWDIGSNGLLKKFLGAEHNYERSIMFFLQPIPDDIAKLFDNKHKFWKSGLELYEYKVLVGESLFDLSMKTELVKGNYPYRVVGTQAARDKFFELLTEEQKEINPRDDYTKRFIEIEKKLGYFGYWGMKIGSTIRKVNRGITISIKEAKVLAKQQGMEEFFYSDIAPFVPHLMLYPGFYGMKYNGKRKIKLK